MNPVSCQIQRSLLFTASVSVLLVIFDDCVDPVRHSEDGAVPELAVDQAGDPGVGVHVHSGGRLVQNQQFGISKKKS